jgi:hypothetical protein
MLIHYCVVCGVSVLPETRVYDQFELLWSDLPEKKKALFLKKYLVY